MSGRPTFQHCTFYPHAIPQYNVGYGRFKDLMTQTEAMAPGLFLAGHYREGISLGDSIVSGINVVDRSRLAREGQARIETCARSAAP